MDCDACSLAYEDPEEGGDNLLLMVYNHVRF
jgi:hypothetical protein